MCSKKIYRDKGIELFRITTQRADQPNREARDVYFKRVNYIVLLDRKLLLFGFWFRG